MARSIPKGTIITCENGHKVCRVLAEIKPGDAIQLKKFKFFGKTPKPGSDAVCPECKSPLFRGGPWPNQVHTTEGWYSSREETA